MTSESEHSDRRMLMFAIGLAGGLLLGIAIGYYMAYNASLHYAAQAITDYIMQMPIECQNAVGLGNLTIIIPMLPKTNSTYEPIAEVGDKIWNLTK